MAYEITFAESVADQLQFLTAAERRTVLAAIERQLVREPLVETRNRKPLRPNPVAPWELRVGPLRVFYEVVPDPPAVQVLAIGKKRQNILLIAGRKIEL
jgi:mRNA-degrading endonuclease RelE of RelBE toxin-antitoxin system